MFEVSESVKTNDQSSAATSIVTLPLETMVVSEKNFDVNQTTKCSSLTIKRECTWLTWRCSLLFEWIQMYLVILYLHLILLLSNSKYISWYILKSLKVLTNSGQSFFSHIPNDWLCRVDKCLTVVGERILDGVGWTIAWRYRKDECLSVLGWRMLNRVGWTIARQCWGTKLDGVKWTIFHWRCWMDRLKKSDGRCLTVCEGRILDGVG